MYPKLLHLYGPFELNSFNALIIVGIAVFMRAVLAHPGRDAYISKDDFINLSLEAALAGIIGGRLVHVLSDWQHYSSLYDILSIWNGGLSILGAILGVFSYSIISLTAKHIPPLAVFDIAALYAPLIHAIARIGCFLTGCCYGAQTAVPWAIEYVHPLIVAPLHIKIHPTQLYSSALYFLLFFALRRVSAYYPVGTGRLLMLYLMGMSLERLLVDFFRGDRIMMAHPAFQFLSFHQWLALAIFCTAGIGLVYLERKSHSSSPSLKV
ncbi:prolipoprotein diacylglyceryl transferase [Candidatus Dependentiae bacterium]|nr:prolipoprotein diacylglyceryl transferase [Candidatus Dependentiae bacterium]